MSTPLFETSDTCLGAYLLTCKVPYRGCYVNEDDRITFRFARDERLGDIQDNYRFDFEAPARTLLSHYKWLALQAKQVRRNGGGAL